MSECKEFHKLYSNGKALAETLFGDAFTYEENESIGYDLWFFNENINPNNAVAKNLQLNSSVTECHLFNGADRHKSEGPGPEASTTAECLPWRKNSCCSHTKTALNVDMLHNLYGAEYRWDRCGPLTPACERFFVYEACFYECEPLAGLYRRFTNNSDASAGLHEAEFNGDNESHNQWELYKMPIKASFWDAWHTACYNDKFCAADSGNFFSCAKVPVAPTNAPAVAVKNESSNTGLVAGLAIVSSLLGLLLIGIIVFCLCCRKKKNRNVESSPHNMN